MNETKRAAWAAFASLVSGAIFLATGACSFVLETTGAQCQGDDECKGRGASFANTVCNSKHLCVTGAAIDTGGPCTTHKECTDRRGEAAICRSSDKTCAPLRSDRCDRIAGSTATDGPVLVLGGLVPKAGHQAAAAAAMENAVQLAVDELNGSAALRTAKGEAFTVAYVGCNEGVKEDASLAAGTGTDEGARAAALAHLNDDLGVPVVIGPSGNDASLEVARTMVDRGTMLLSTLATTPAIASLPDDGLVWQVLPPDDDQATTLAAIGDLYDLTAEAAQGIPMGGRRVAVVVRGDSYGKALADRLLPLLKFNGKPLSDPANADSFRRIDYPAEPTAADVATAVAAMLHIGATERGPTWAFLLGGSETTAIVELAEKKWTEYPNPTPPRARYVLAHQAAALGLFEQLANLPNTAYNRVAAAYPVRRNSNSESFGLRYSAVPDFAGTDPNGLGARAAYDATYAAAYAAVAAPGGALTGAALAEGMRRLAPPGRPFDVGPTRIADAVQVLASGQSIDLSGATGKLDFDPARGAPRDVVDIACTELSGSTGKVIFRTTGKYFDPTANGGTGGIVGTFGNPRCAGLGGIN